MRQKQRQKYGKHPNNGNKNKIYPEKTSARKLKKLRALDEYNAKCYYSDIEYLGRLRGVSPATKEWVELRMYELRASANIYEHNLAEYFISKKIKFIHQAPFVFYGKKIYFAVFFLPEHRMVIEVDGEYHNSNKQFSYDRERDAAFRAIKIKTVRLANSETKDKKMLALRLSEFEL